MAGDTAIDEEQDVPASLSEKIFEELKARIDCETGAISSIEAVPSTPIGLEELLDGGQEERKCQY